MRPMEACGGSCAHQPQWAVMPQTQLAWAATQHLAQPCQRLKVPRTFGAGRCAARTEPGSCSAGQW